MKLLRKAFGFLARSLSPEKPTGWSSGTTSHAGEVVNGSNSLMLSAVWACTNLLAGTIASLPLTVYRTGPAGQRTAAREHSLYRILHDSPNADQTAVDFWEYVSFSLELWGNAFARKETINGRLVSLTPVNPVLVTVTRQPHGGLAYQWSENGRAYTVDETGMFHIRGFGGGPLGGVSTLSCARHVFGLAMAIDRAAGATFANGLRPSGTLTFDTFLTDAQYTIAEERLSSKYSGAMAAGRPMILEGGVKWEQITINPEDAQMLQSRAFSVEEICRFFGVPPFMVGHTEKSTSWGSGLEQQILGFQKFTLRRRLKRIEQAIMKQLLTAADRASGITVEFNIEGLLRGDSRARAEFYTALLGSGVLTVNEARALENLPPVHGGDVPRTQMQNVPLGMAIPGTQRSENRHAGT